MKKMDLENSARLAGHFAELANAEAEAALGEPMKKLFLRQAHVQRRLAAEARRRIKAGEYEPEDPALAAERADPVGMTQVREQAASERVRELEGIIESVRRWSQGMVDMPVDNEYCWSQGWDKSRQHHMKLALSMLPEKEQDDE